MAKQPDELYLRSREDLLLYEDSRFNGLINGVPNFYIAKNEHTIWGEVLRALAIELAKLEYAYAYDLVNKEPQFLTPPDIKRRWAGPLFVSKNFPGNDQFDLDYKTMLVALLSAYREGATTQAIHDVILAYTGKDIVVEELYKQIGVFFDQSDRNSIRVSVRVGGSNPLTDIQSLNQLQQITRSLYGAIDLTKPAHVGLNFTTVFSEGEDLDDLITEIQDQLRIFVKLIEDEPFNPMLIIAPVLDPTNPDTTVTGHGMALPKTLTISQFNSLPTKPSYASAASPSLKDGYKLQNSTYVLQIQGGPGLTSPTRWIGITRQLDWSVFSDATTAFLAAVTGEVANWDLAHPAGLVAPRLNRVWEIQDDQLATFELD